MQIGIFTVGDVTADPTTGRTPTENERIKATVGEVLELGVVLRDEHRVVGRDQRGRRGEDDLLGLGADVGERGRRRGGDERRVVVLAGGEHVQPDLLGLLRDRDGRLDPLVLRRRPPG